MAIVWIKDQRLYARGLELLFSQSSSAFISSGIAGAVLIYAYWPISNPQISLLWVLGYFSVAAYRIRLRRLFDASSWEEKNSDAWFGPLGLSIFITGVLWGFYLVYLATFADGIYAAILMANYAFLLAGAVTAYAVSLPVFLLFSSPVVVPSVVYQMYAGNSYNWLLAVVALSWYLFMVSTARRFSEFSSRALAYEYQNQALVTELEEQNRRAEVLAQELLILSNTDALTGLHNRRYFDDVMVHEIARAKRLGAPLALILCDVDFFKRYNDTLGHLEGDRCLRKVGEILAAAIRDGTDIVARFGGEEFALILTNTDLDEARVFAERLRHAVKHAAIPHPSSEVASVVTISLGIAAIVGDAGESDDALLARADQALYISKERGRDQVQACAG